MKLFLGGGGEKEDSIELDKKFVFSLDLSKPLLYIPIAINTDKHPYSGCLEWLLDVFGPLGVKNIVMWIEDDLKQKQEKDFEQFAGVYIGGGNTFKLLKELKEFGTFEILRKLARKGVPIYGGSAGAIIFAKTIIPALSADENFVELTDFSALNLVRNYDMWCHYSESLDSMIKSYMSKYYLKKIIAIPENTGLYVTEESIEVVGPSEMKIFEGDDIKTISPGALL
ncbi:MAG: Type 1 glutamine amidotransferase-like domain-containing protein [Candidatus Zambryskibacteria bacterium]|nr:Type 1 glutamine amidotransferase-like domain-containing protein [Candidatus Zambryskibacteria bacterium]